MNAASLHPILAVLVQASHLEHVQDVVHVEFGKAVGEHGAGQVRVAVEVEGISGEHMIHFMAAHRCLAEGLLLLGYWRIEGMEHTIGITPTCQSNDHMTVNSHCTRIQQIISLAPYCTGARNSPRPETHLVPSKS